MAKGDSERLRGDSNLENTRLMENDRLFRSSIMDPQYWMLNDQFQQANARDQAQYGKLQQGFDQFAQDGGFSPQDISAFRARAAAPIRAGYSNALREVDRARTLGGGSMPGYAALRGRMMRDTNQAMSDSAIGSNAAIAQLVQQGKLAGLQGGSNLYGTTPGQTSMFGNQMLKSADQYLDLNRLDVQRADTILGSKARAAQVPGKWAQTFAGIGQFAKDMGQGISGAAAPWSGDE